MNKKKGEIYWPKNERIKGDKVRVVSDNVEKGIYKRTEAQRMADEMGLDLILINTKTKPVICKIADYGKMVYQEKKRRKDIEKKNRERRTEMKELRFTPNIGEGDIKHKSKKAIEFLKDGNKVKLSVKFKGREMVHQEQGKKLLLEFFISLEDYAETEKMPEMQGRFMNMILKPKK